MKFVRFFGKGDYGGFRGRRFRIRPRNSGGTILIAFRCPFCTKFEISPERLVVRVRRRLHRVSRKNLRMDA